MFLKNKNYLLITIFLITLLILVPFQVNAFSNALKNFVSNGKQVQLKIFDNLEQAEILSGTNVEIKNLDGSQRTFLSKNKEYIISPYQENQQSWFIQVFATEERSKAENIQENLQKEFENYEVQISYENELYKVQVGTFIKEARAEEISEIINEAGWETWVIEKEIKADTTQLVVKDKEGNIVFENGTIYCNGVIRLKNNLYNGMIQFSLTDGEIDVFNKVGGQYSSSETSQGYSNNETRQIQLVDDTIFAEPSQIYQVRFPEKDIKVRVKNLKTVSFS